PQLHARDAEPPAAGAEPRPLRDRRSDHRPEQGEEGGGRRGLAPPLDPERQVHQGRYTDADLRPGRRWLSDRRSDPRHNRIPEQPEVIAEVSEANEFYMVLVTVFILIAAMYFLQKWWTSYR